jgi:hypothetical protein
MTIDELIRLVENKMRMWLRVPDDTPLKPTSAIGYPHEIQMKYDGMWQVYTLIRTNRTALEAEFIEEAPE